MKRAPACYSNVCDYYMYIPSEVILCCCSPQRLLEMNEVMLGGPGKLYPYGEYLENVTSLHVSLHVFADCKDKPS